VGTVERRAGLGLGWISPVAANSEQDTKVYGARITTPFRRDTLVPCPQTDAAYTIAARPPP